MQTAPPVDLYGTDGCVICGSVYELSHQLSKIQSFIPFFIISLCSSLSCIAIQLLKNSTTGLYSHGKQEKVLECQLQLSGMYNNSRLLTDSAVMTGTTVHDILQWSLPPFKDGYLCTTVYSGFTLASYLSCLLQKLFLLLMT